MSEHVEHRPKPPRFPFVAAALCTACVGAAGWTWMRYSYCWSVSCPQVGRGIWDNRHGWLDRYVSVAGFLDMPPNEPEWVILRPSPVAGWGTPAYLGDPQHDLRPSAFVRFEGRICVIADSRQPGRFGVDTTASRFTGASIAGLAVGAMGVFVFAVALRHYIECRRASKDAVTS